MGVVYSSLSGGNDTLTWPCFCYFIGFVSGNIIRPDHLGLLFKEKPGHFFFQEIKCPRNLLNALGDPNPKVRSFQERFFWKNEPTKFLFGSIGAMLIEASSPHSSEVSSFPQKMKSSAPKKIRAAARASSTKVSPRSRKRARGTIAIAETFWRNISNWD